MATAPSNKRILTEIQRLQGLATASDASSTKFILEKSPADDASSNVIIGKILPNSNIYNQAAFQIELKLPAEYPFKAPEIRFITPIYHPNVDDKGKICVDIVNAADGYKPTTQLVDIVKAIGNLIDHPNIDHALSPEIGQEYTLNRAAFDKKALDSVRKHGLPRQ